VLDGSHIFQEPPVPALLVTLENHPTVSAFQLPLLKRFSNGFVLTTFNTRSFFFGGSFTPDIIIHFFNYFFKKILEATTF
jgi:hypothetical protein